jgi:hypothetical protein
MTRRRPILRWDQYIRKDIKKKERRTWQDI